MTPSITGQAYRHVFWHPSVVLLWRGVVGSLERGVTGEMKVGGCTLDAQYCKRLWIVLLGCVAVLGVLIR